MMILEQHYREVNGRRKIAIKARFTPQYNKRFN